MRKSNVCVTAAYQSFVTNCLDTALGGCVLHSHVDHDKAS